MFTKKKFLRQNTTIFHLIHPYTIPKR